MDIYGISERRGGVTTFQHSGIKNNDAQSVVAQTVSATREYDAFGNVASSAGTFAGPFGYGGSYGYQSDSETGYKLLGHRYYDSETGRFLTRDSAKDGRNWYAYCDNNPLTRADPEGLSWFPEPWQGDVRNGSSGDIIVIGEPGRGKPAEAIVLHPGERDPDNFDADQIATPDGKGGWVLWGIGAELTTSGDIVVGKTKIRAKRGSVYRLPGDKRNKERRHAEDVMRKGFRKGKGTMAPK